MALLANYTSALLAEKERLVRSIGGFYPSGGHAATVQAVRDFLFRFHNAGIPWVRMYQSFPPWQQRCALLNQEWDRDLQGAMVIFTLLDPLGDAISRKALGGGTWKSTGAHPPIPIGQNHLVVSKLYHKAGGITAFEFRLTMQLQPRVAICVLHPTNYRRIIPDLKLYIRQGYFPGGNQPPPVSTSLNDLSQLLFSDNSMPEFGGQHSDAALMSIESDFHNLL